MLRKIYFLIITSLIGLCSVAQENNFDTVGGFEEFVYDAGGTALSDLPETTHLQHQAGDGIYWTAAILFFTATAGLLVRYKRSRTLRPLFLVASIAILGFYRGSCPCSIQSLQHGIMAIAGDLVSWPSVLLFAGLLPLTYVFGRVYCGWICQLGAIQEFIFRTAGFSFLQSENARKIMRTIRLALLLLLIAQLLITHTNLYRNIDPFIAIFNFYSNNAVTWILVVLLVVSSVFMYRPFCKTACPVGLVLGWVSRLPGASVLAVKPSCNSCLLCSKTCHINAITHDGRYSVLDNQECIRCGNCLDSCKKDAMTFVRKSRHNHALIECKPPLPLSATEQMTVAWLRNSKRPKS